MYEYLGTGASVNFERIVEVSLKNSRLLFAKVLYSSYDGQIRKCITYLLILQVRVEEIISRNSSSLSSCERSRRPQSPAHLGHIALYMYYAMYVQYTLQT